MNIGMPVVHSTAHTTASLCSATGHTIMLSVTHIPSLLCETKYESDFIRMDESCEGDISVSAMLISCKIPLCQLLAGSVVLINSLCVLEDRSTPM